MEFWLISRPEVATPPALEALPGEKMILPVLAWKNSTASRVLGMLAPSMTAMQPLAIRFLASSRFSSFWMAQGRATSTFCSQGRLPAWNWAVLNFWA